MVFTYTFIINFNFFFSVGHSRIPIYKEEKKNIQGYILAKFLIGVSPKSLIPITQMRLYDATYVQTSDELWTVFHGFIKGKNHLVSQILKY